VAGWAIYTTTQLQLQLQLQLKDNNNSNSNHNNNNNDNNNNDNDNDNDDYNDSDSDNDNDNDDEPPTVSSVSLFDRLQSLLVEEVSDDDDDRNDKSRVSDDSDNDSDSDNESLGFLDGDDDDDESIDAKIRAIESGFVEENRKHAVLDVVDVSDLTVEERTFLQLSKAGLVKARLHPPIDLVVSSASGSGSGTSSSSSIGEPRHWRAHSAHHYTNKIENEIENENEHDSDHDHDPEGVDRVLGSMASELDRVGSRTNLRISLLDKLAGQKPKGAEDQQALLIARCQALMKRTKEKAKKAKQKSHEALNLPW